MCTDPSIYYNETATSQPASVNDLVEHILISGNSFYIPLDDDIDSEYWCKLTLENESKLIKFQYLSNTDVYSYHILNNSLNIVSSSHITESITLEFNNIGYVLFTGGIGGENNSLPQITSFTLTPEFPLPTDILTATLTASDADGDQIDLNIIWCINGVEISNNIDTNAIEERSYQLDLNTLPAITDSDVITLKVIPNDGLSDGASIGGANEKSLKRGSVSRSPGRVGSIVTDNEEEGGDYRNMNRENKHQRSNKKLKAG